MAKTQREGSPERIKPNLVESKFKTLKKSFEKLKLPETLLPLAEGLQNTLSGLKHDLGELKRVFRDGEEEYPELLRGFETKLRKLSDLKNVLDNLLSTPDLLEDSGIERIRQFAADAGIKVDIPAESSHGDVDDDEPLPIFLDQAADRRENSEDDTLDTADDTVDTTTDQVHENKIDEDATNSSPVPPPPRPSKSRVQREGREGHREQRETPKEGATLYLMPKEGEDESIWTKVRFLREEQEKGKPRHWVVIFRDNGDEIPLTPLKLLDDYPPSAKMKSDFLEDKKKHESREERFKPGQPVYYFRREDGAYLTGIYDGVSKNGANPRVYLSYKSSGEPRYNTTIKFKDLVDKTPPGAKVIPMPERPQPDNIERKSKSATRDRGTERNKKEETSADFPKEGEMWYLTFPPKEPHEEAQEELFRMAKTELRSGKGYIRFEREDGSPKLISFSEWRNLSKRKTDRTFKEVDKEKDRFKEGEEKKYEGFFGNPKPGDIFVVVNFRTQDDGTRGDRNFIEFVQIVPPSKEKDVIVFKYLTGINKGREDQRTRNIWNDGTVSELVHRASRGEIKNLQEEMPVHPLVLYKEPVQQENNTEEEFEPPETGFFFQGAPLATGDYLSFDEGGEREPFVVQIGKIEENKMEVISRKTGKSRYFSAAEWADFVRRNRGARDIYVDDFDIDEQPTVMAQTRPLLIENEALTISNPAAAPTPEQPVVAATQPDQPQQPPVPAVEGPQAREARPAHHAEHFEYVFAEIIGKKKLHNLHSRFAMAAIEGSRLGENPMEEIRNEMRDLFSHITNEQKQLLEPRLRDRANFQNFDQFERQWKTDGWMVLHNVIDKMVAQDLQGFIECDEKFQALSSGEQKHGKANANHDDHGHGAPAAAPKKPNKVMAWVMERFNKNKAGIVTGGATSGVAATLNYFANASISARTTAFAVGFLSTVAQRFSDRSKHEKKLEGIEKEKSNIYARIKDKFLNKQQEVGGERMLSVMEAILNQGVRSGTETDVHTESLETRIKHESAEYQRVLEYVADNPDLTEQEKTALFKLCDKIDEHRNELRLDRALLLHDKNNKATAYTDTVRAATNNSAFFAKAWEKAMTDVSGQKLGLYGKKSEFLLKTFASALFNGAVAFSVVSFLPNTSYNIADVSPAAGRAATRFGVVGTAKGLEAAYLKGREVEAHQRDLLKKARALLEHGDKESRRKAEQLIAEAQHIATFGEKAWAGLKTGAMAGTIGAGIGAGVDALRSTFFADDYHKSLDLQNEKLSEYQDVPESQGKRFNAVPDTGKGAKVPMLDNPLLQRENALKDLKLRTFEIQKGDGLLSAANNFQKHPELGGKLLDSLKSSHKDWLSSANVKAKAMGLSGERLNDFVDKSILHRWRVEEVERFGVRMPQKGGEWLYTKTIHPGAKIELVFGNDGPHLQIADKNFVTEHAPRTLGPVEDTSSKYTLESRQVQIPGNVNPNELQSAKQFIIHREGGGDQVAIARDVQLGKNGIATVTQLDGRVDRVNLNKAGFNSFIESKTSTKTRLGGALDKQPSSAYDTKGLPTPPTEKFVQSQFERVSPAQFPQGKHTGTFRYNDRFSQYWIQPEGGRSTVYIKTSNGDLLKTDIRQLNGPVRLRNGEVVSVGQALLDKYQVSNFKQAVRFVESEAGQERFGEGRDDVQMLRNYAAILEHQNNFYDTGAMERRIASKYDVNVNDPEVKAKLAPTLHDLKSANKTALRLFEKGVVEGKSPREIEKLIVPHIPGLDADTADAIHGGEFRKSALQGDLLRFDDRTLDGVLKATIDDIRFKDAQKKIDQLSVKRDDT